jgi:uncharacterized protein (DUF1697 family)
MTMALVVFLKGVNVGGYRRCRPSDLARQLKRYDVVNIGAAGTWVVRKPPSRATLRAELKRRLPFDAEVMICTGADIRRLVAADPFANESADRSIIQFVSVLAQRRLPLLTLPLSQPADGEWMVKILEHQQPFVLGVHRRQMKAIGYLSRLEKIFGAQATTRSWSTIQKVARILEAR